MGSGKYLKFAQKKYGLENFKKEILFVFSTPEEMYAKEAEIVNEEFLATENTYNLKIGGFGGWDYINSSDLACHSKDHMKMMHEIGKEKRDRSLSVCRADPEWREMFSERVSAAQKERAKKPDYVNSFVGKTHTEEARRRISAAAKENQSGERNSQYGKPKSEEQIMKMKETLSKKAPIKCPHCSKESNNEGVMYRWHFDKCKQKNLLL
jgi:hypothetical protein